MMGKGASHSQTYLRGQQERPSQQRPSQGVSFLLAFCLLSISVFIPLKKQKWTRYPEAYLERSA